MVARQKKFDKESARQRRAELYAAVQRGELTLQDAVKEMRKIAGMTQAEFAVHRGVSAKVIKDIERGVGNPTVASLNRIGNFFGLEVAFVRSENLVQNRSLTHPEPLSLVAVPNALEESRLFARQLDSIQRTVEAIQREIQAPHDLAKLLADIESARALPLLPASGDQ
jgi:transcriptional regulator with XRE-family HTH domain